MPPTQAAQPNMSKSHAEHGAADQAAEEIAGEIKPACRAAIGGRRAADKARGAGLGEEGAGADQHHADQHRRQARQDEKRKSEAATASAAQKVGLVPKRFTACPASGVVAIAGRKTK